MDKNEFPNIPMDEKERSRFPERIWAWMGHQDNGSWDREPCSCCPSIKYIRCDEILTNTEILLFIMGFQGGSVHQCASDLGVKTGDILSAGPDEMQELMRMAQKFRNTRATDTRIQQLEAALNVCLGHMTGGMDGNWKDCDPIAVARDVLAGGGNDGNHD